MAAGALEGAGAGIGAIATMYGLSVPVRRRLRRRATRQELHNLDHEGRPERRDPATGQVIEPARPGIAAALDGIGETVEAMHARQIQIGQTLTDVQQRLGQQDDQRQKIDQIYEMVHELKRTGDLRHEQNRTAIAETRAATERFSRDVAELRLTFRATEDKVFAAVADLQGQLAHAVAELEGRVDRMDQRIEARLVEQIGFIAETIPDQPAH